MDNQQAVVKSLVFGEPRADEMCDPTGLAANLVQLLCGARPPARAKCRDGAFARSRSVPDIPCHLWPTCKARFIFLQQMYANVTFLCHRIVRRAITELFGGLVILAEKLLTPSSVLEAAGL